MARPRDGKEIKIVSSVRIEPKKKREIIKEYGSLGKALDYVYEIIKKAGPKKEG